MTGQSVGMQLPDTIRSMFPDNICIGFRSEGFVFGGKTGRHYHLNQVHSAEVAVLNENCDDIRTADAWITSLTDTEICVRTADCLPVLISDAAGRFVAAVHAGWRGLAGGILNHVVKEFGDRNVPAEDLRVLIGPSVRVCCYKVGKELQGSFPEHCFQIQSDGLHLNLQKAAKDQLRILGVKEKFVADTEVCSSCCKDVPSVRRDGADVERMESWIKITGS